MEVSAGDASESPRTLDPGSLEKNCPADQGLTLSSSSSSSHQQSSSSSSSSSHQQSSSSVPGDRMDITKGFLDDISRPASGEIRRLSRDRPRSLEVLSPDVTLSEQVQADLTAENSSDQEESDEENEDLELRKAIKKMKRLDRILALKASAEREVKQRGREQHQRLWQELQTTALRTSSSELENTRRFLALSPNNYQDCDEVDLVRVFETEVLDLMSAVNTQTDAGQQVTEDQSSDGRQRGAARSERRQDFVRRNIELAGASGNAFLLTPQEKERIEELLKDLEEDQNDSKTMTEPQVVSSSLSVGEGFSPEPAELHNLHHIDSRLQLLLPVQDFLSVRSSSQKKNTGDAERQRRDDERRLQEIQQQLQLLEESEANTSVHLSDEDLRNLLLECEEDMIRSPAGSSSQSSLRTSSALDASPRLSGSDLLQDISAQ